MNERSSSSSVAASATAALLAVLVGLAAGVVAAQSPAGPAWNREAAAKYLDERIDAWFAAGKPLRTGDGEVTCVSCHTVVPYVLARPALRRAMHMMAPTPQEARVLQGVVRRVATYDTQQLFYDVNDAKKVESRGTEAVVNALILATADVGRDRRTLGDPTARAFRHLWDTQRPDGAWDWLDFGLEPFESAGATYYGATLAAMAVGVAGSAARPTGEGAAGANKLRAYLTERYAGQNLFNRVSLLLASTRWKDLLPPAQRDALVAELRKAQQPDGGWSLGAMPGWRWGRGGWRPRPPGTPDATLLAKSDGYATGLIVYTLRCAGIGVDDPAVRSGLRWLGTHQQSVQVGERSYAAWRSHSLNHDREHGGERGESWRRLFMSDAATAFAVLALIGPD
jgi:squalene-hopene/tetraprenyl-beta-curcumene cyclase